VSRHGSGLKIRIVCPSPPGSRSGNRVTALRWARILRGLGHRVAVETAYRDAPCDLLIVLHARRGAASAARFRRLHPGRPLIVALTGTDVYRDIHRSRRARESLAIADRIVVLQALAVRELPRTARPKTRVIVQSAESLDRAPARGRKAFDVAVVGHLRSEKDPFRAATAARRLPPESSLRVLHAGRAGSRAMERRVRAEAERNPRYRWLGDVSHSAARRLIARSRLLVLTSRMEGGANVIAEAVVAGVPVLSSRIPGSVGLLGPSYPGYFPPGSTTALRGLLIRAESDPRFLAALGARVRALAPRFAPRRERAAWKGLLGELERA
jgi:putative glycosyltransferase (TIGR04348 family)